MTKRRFASNSPPVGKTEVADLRKKTRDRRRERKSPHNPQYTTILSLGAGVQSSVMALMLNNENSPLHAAGFATPCCAIFADTGWEPDPVYEHLRWLTEQLQYPVFIVRAGNIKENLHKAKGVDGHNFIDVPLFSVGQDGKKGMLRRQCTAAYKIRPITRFIRRLNAIPDGYPFPKGHSVKVYMGISTDEAERMKDSQTKWMQHEYPLIAANLNRAACQQWFAKHVPDRTLPRSACVICPYHSDQEWLGMDEASRQEAIAFDTFIRQPGSPPRLQCNDPLFLHSSRKPLAEAIEEMRLRPRQLNFESFGECEGYCGN